MSFQALQLNLGKWSWCVMHHVLRSTTVNSRRCMSGVVDPPDMSPPIPVYEDRSSDEPMETKRARLLYQSRKRGMTENGLLLSTFAARYLNKLTDTQLHMYDTLINKPTNDWEIYYWITGTKATPEQYDNEIMDMLKKHTRNEDQEVRLQQPSLPDLSA
ncbi:succinate dehydrogenase assembly factor 2, mitochondrial-like [Mya arenaria]|uniref:succinate dehydrogenase assembly factor 2, mitochondrial-like n=1 Tax=Mya arenaria TaxID=6604 RepID=UPI0022E6A265|nr:succinate dehydrogenase assembly factor 2, mitochondrial-like [Mya arenaria]